MITYEIGDQCKEYIYTVIGQCIGCIEFEVAQDLNGNKIKIVTDTHGGVGFIGENAKGTFDNMKYANKDDSCTVPDDEKRGPHICDRCWMNKAFEAGLEAGKAERDRLRKAITQYLDCQTTNQWVTHFLKALKGG